MKNYYQKLNIIASSNYFTMHFSSSFSGCSSSKAKNGEVSIVNVSYDPTREFYEEYNKIFAKHWYKTHQQDVEVIQSHGGSGKQALEVANGLEADVVTLALEYDINSIQDAGLIKKVG